MFGGINGTLPSGVLENQVYDTYYNTFAGGYGIPYTIFYKIKGVSIDSLRFTAIKSAEFNQKLDELVNPRILPSSYFRFYVSALQIASKNIYCPIYLEYPSISYPVYISPYSGFFTNYEKKYIEK